MLNELTTFPVAKILEDFDFEAAADVPKAPVQELSGLALVEQRESVLLLGPRGSGNKLPRHRPGHVGHRARLEGAFITAADLVLLQIDTD